MLLENEAKEFSCNNLGWYSSWPGEALKLGSFVFKPSLLVIPTKSVSRPWKEYSGRLAVSLQDFQKDWGDTQAQRVPRHSEKVELLGRIPHHTIGNSSTGVLW